MTSDLTTQCKKVPWYGNRGTQVQVSKPKTETDIVGHTRKTFYMGITILTHTNYNISRTPGWPHISPRRI